MRIIVEIGDEGRISQGPTGVLAGEALSKGRGSFFCCLRDHEVVINRVDEGAATWVERAFELSRRHNAGERLRGEHREP